MYYVSNEDFICHYGRKGMKWGENIFEGDDPATTYYRNAYNTATREKQKEIYNMIKQTHNSIDKHSRSVDKLQNKKNKIKIKNEPNQVRINGKRYEINKDPNQVKTTNEVVRINGKRYEIVKTVTDDVGKSKYQLKPIDNEHDNKNLKKVNTIEQKIRATQIGVNVVKRYQYKRLDEILAGQSKKTMGVSESAVADAVFTWGYKQGMKEMRER